MIRLFYQPAPHAYRRDLPRSEVHLEVHLRDTAHFALETHAVDIADHIDDFLNRIALF